MIEVLDREYCFNHGAAPRGRGNWAFSLVNPNRHDYLEFIVWANGRYSDALKVAKAVLGGKVEGSAPEAEGGSFAGSVQVSAKERVSFRYGPKVAELLKSGQHESVLYVCS